MGTKENILSLFETNKGVYFSGEEIAARLSVSRTAVWKAVNNLRKEGYVIDAVPNRGYSLSVNTDILSEQGIRKYLSPACKNLELWVLPEADSTNTLLRKKANVGSPEGCVAIAGAQTKGRGRLGRSFHSPADTGVYMSLLLRPNGISSGQGAKYTTMAAVAVCEAVEEVAGKQAWIKWVNDIYVDGRKVSGILTEASISMEDDSLNYVVLGVGINAYLPKGGFPKDIEAIAGAVFSQKCDDGKNALAAGFLNHFMNYYIGKENVGYAGKYRDRSLAIGKEVTVLSAAGGRKAFALDVDDKCRLIVQYEDGSIEHLSFGEISIGLS